MRSAFRLIALLLGALCLSCLRSDEARKWGFVFWRKLKSIIQITCVESSLSGSSLAYCMQFVPSVAVNRNGRSVKTVLGMTEDQLSVSRLLRFYDAPPSSPAWKAQPMRYVPRPAGSGKRARLRAILSQRGHPHSRYLERFRVSQRRDDFQTMERRSFSIDLVCRFIVEHVRFAAECFMRQGSLTASERAPPASAMIWLL